MTIVVSAKSGDDAAAAALGLRVGDLCASALAVRVLRVPALYHLDDASGVWGEIAASEAVIVASWLHVRPMRWLVDRHCPAARWLGGVNLGEYASAEEAARAIGQLVEAAGSVAAGPGVTRSLDEPVRARWYPVVDRSRCKDCGHCLQFCLFGVYERDAAHHVRVTDPDRCKPGCPACSRVCPEGAIVFPLYGREPAIAGAPGLFMSPDPPARAMYYNRTHLRCPRCGNDGSAKFKGAATGGRLCDECGRPLLEASVPPATRGASFDDLDVLIDTLDKRNLGRR